MVGCTVVLSRARTAVDPDAGKKRGGNEVEELADEARERKRRVDKGSMENREGNRAETERRKEEKLLNVAAKWNGN